MAIVACTPTPPTIGEVSFVLSEFTTAYPEFAVLPAAPSAACQANFNLATIFISNCCDSAIIDATVRQTLLYLLTAHITFLFTPCGANNGSPQGIVGRIDSATEGSVTVHAEMPTTLESGWFNQTKYGAQFWAITAAVRTMHYIPAPNYGGGPPGPLDIGFGPGWNNGGWP